MIVQVQDCESYLSKPDIKMGNYYFQWESDGLGLTTGEINHFKNLIRKLIPVLEHYMIFLQDEKKENSINKNDPYRDKKQISIKDKYNKEISFLMLIDSQGSTVFFREETCDIDVRSKFKDGHKIYSENPSKIDSNDSSDIKIDLKWLLGELLFDRKGNKINQFDRKGNKINQSVKI